MSQESIDLLNFAGIPLTKALLCQGLSVVILLLMASDVRSTVQLGRKRISFLLLIAELGFFLSPLLFMPTYWMAEPMRIAYYGCASIAAVCAWMVTEPIPGRRPDRKGLRWVGSVAFIIIYSPIWLGVWMNVKPPR